MRGSRSGLVDVAGAGRGLHAALDLGRQARSSARSRPMMRTAIGASIGGPFSKRLTTICASA